MSDASLEALVQDYVTIGDDQFLNELANGKKFTEPEIAVLAGQIQRRQIWKRVEDFREAQIGEDRQEDFFERLSIDCDEPGKLIKDTVEPKATKDLTAGARPLFRDAQGVYCCAERDWRQLSPLIEALGEEEKRIVRIYYTGEESKAASHRLRALSLEAEYRSGVKHDCT